MNLKLLKETPLLKEHLGRSVTQMAGSLSYLWIDDETTVDH